MKVSLVYFAHDLRLHDNAALLAATQSDYVICLYCIDPLWFKKDRYNNQHMGSHRWKFLLESLNNLTQSLEELGQKLYISNTASYETISFLLKSYPITSIYRNQSFGVYENNSWQRLQEENTQHLFITKSSHTLFLFEELSFSSVFPKTFSEFRRKIKNKNIRPITKKVISLPPPFRIDINAYSFALPPLYSAPNHAANKYEYHLFRGGEKPALEHCNHYFSTSQPLSYKKTRNNLDGWNFSSKFSPWLANGCLSVRKITQQLSIYEEQYGANESTQWIYLELLWREYFQWYAQHYHSKLFHFSGINQKRPLSTFYPQRFKQWTESSTQWPLINALMAQLNTTGYMSNRGRQIVASCLIYELGLDWRCGAAYFEQQLIDHDVAVNWGNWQYIAGVGADPRGGRHFNIEKQAQLYDPDNKFIEKWGLLASPNRCSLSIDSVDAADWPISPTP